MKKLLVKMLLFLSPLILLLAFTCIFYSTDKGDLLRTGYIMDIYPHYRDIFRKEFERSIYFTNISDLKLSPKKKYSVLTLGDSFSEQGCFGYKNYLGENEGISILHFNLKNENQIQVLMGLLNGDFFETVSIKYVILQFTERNIITRINEADTSYILSYKEIGQWSVKEKQNIEKKDGGFNFPTDRIIKFPYYNLRYLLKKDTCYSVAYRTKIDNDLFSVNNKELLFYADDLGSVKQNNIIENIIKLNKVINDLSEKLNKKGVRLIALPAPDKYDIYYEYTTNKAKFTRPLFFEHLNSMPKKYIYVDSKQILSNAIRKEKDIYFYDDTHWSPIGSRLIAEELNSIISDNN